MNHYRFTKPDGTTLAWVNLETIHAAHPSGEHKVTIHTPTFTVDVDSAQFEEAMKKQPEGKDQSVALNRLTQAIDRLVVRIPSSIRLHM